ncbi:hypothetical protein Trco_008454 [Trichoderma cornu-damae]|uniref:Uncharacterized protein n=1 Tax=Trichoderma cornu-damae TaxID=654480 RepID=A0A9P8TSU1_9HYPO|nr:hypothetical protein Trco_008454 [Trichoderma cornu-damae]
MHGAAWAWRVAQRTVSGFQTWPGVVTACAGVRSQRTGHQDSARHVASGLASYPVLPLSILRAGGFRKTPGYEYMQRTVSK